MFSLAILCLVLQAQATEDNFYTEPRMSAGGDWLTNAGPVPGKVLGGQYTAGALWRVVAPHLNCRRQPGITSPLVMSFRQGQLVQANLQRGGSDEVLINAKDRLGRTWMWVRSPAGQDLNCFVRAQRTLIQPVRIAPKPAAAVP